MNICNATPKQCMFDDSFPFQEYMLIRCCLPINITICMVCQGWIITPRYQMENIYIQKLGPEMLLSRQLGWITPFHLAAAADAKYSD
nr:hypothetical protein Q903MT_gene3397 [Picea sitchensis]